MKKKLPSFKFIGLLTVFLGFLALLAIGYYTYINFFSENKTFTSRTAFFSVTLPRDAYYFEKELTPTSGEVFFSLKPIDPDDPKGIMVYYEIPTIDGKGGMCIDSEGNSAWEKVTIAGQELDKCFVDGGYYSAGYLENPIHEAEYYITSVVDISLENLDSLLSMIETSFEFK